MTKVWQEVIQHPDWTKTDIPLRYGSFYGYLGRYGKYKRSFDVSNLYGFQVDGARIIFSGGSVLLIANTGGGKTNVAFAALFDSLVQQKIGVYLVPTTALLSQKKKQIEKFFGNIEIESSDIGIRSAVLVPILVKFDEKEVGQNEADILLTATGENTITEICYRVKRTEHEVLDILRKYHKIGWVKLKKLTVKVISVSGENHPRKKDLERYRKRLIIIATYEAFRAFLFQIQGRHYFKTKKPFGTVVVDETHRIKDQERGWKLETLLYKLREEFKCKLCLLSASFDIKSAQDWAERLDCELLYCKEERTFAYHEILKKFPPFPPDKDEAKKARKEKVGHVVDICQTIAEEAVTPQGEVNPVKVLIFCHSRPQTYAIHRALNRVVKQKDYLGEKFYIEVDYIHAGRSLDAREKVMSLFEKQRGIQFLCCSPLLEVGVDVNNIEHIIITDPELYSPAQLEQMCGRSREEVPNVYFLISEEMRYELYEEKIIVDPDPRESWGKGELKGFRLANDPVISQITVKGLKLKELEHTVKKYNVRLHTRLARHNLNQVLKQLILEELYAHQRTKAELEESLERFEVPYRIINLLKYLEGKMFLRKHKGYYALTHLGRTVVEMGLNPGVAARMLHFFQRHGLHTPDFQTKYRQKLGELIVYTITPKPGEEVGYYDPKWLAEKRRNIRAFMEEIDISGVKNRKALQSIILPCAAKNFLSEGDANAYMKTAIWLAISMYAVWKAYKAHLQTDGEIATVPPPSGITQRNNAMYKRLIKVVHCYQDPDAQWQWKPARRSWRKVPQKSIYAAPVHGVLQKVGEKGATIEEIQSKLREVMPEADTPLKFSRKMIHAVLNSILKDEVSKIADYDSEGTRPPDRYWLKEFTPEVSFDECGTCEQFRWAPQDRPQGYRGCGECKLYKKWIRRRHPACMSYKRKILNMAFLHDLQRDANDKVRCPRCGESDTMLIPTFERASVCNNSQCEALVLRARQARYVLKGNVLIPDHRILKTDKYKYIKKHERIRNIYLKYGETLHLVTKGSGIPVFTIEGRGWERNFVDQVEYVYLAGGSLTMDPESLRIYGVKVEPVPKEKIAADQQRYMKERRLRQLLEQHGLDLYQRAKLRKACDLVKAKIQSNILFCLQIADTRMQKLSKILDSSPPNEVGVEYLWDKRKCPDWLRPLRQQLINLNKVRDIIIQQLDHMYFCHQILQKQVDERKYLLELLISEVVADDETGDDALDDEKNDDKLRSKLNKNLHQMFYLLPQIIQKEQQKIQISPNLNPGRILNKLRSHEGDAERGVWELLKQALPKKFHFVSRQIDRFVRTDLYWGAKALDPYNAALNYMYYLLKGRVQLALQRAGFSFYYPGPGLIHQRDTVYSPRTFENKRNQEIIYDVMDTYRPVFRYYLLCAFQPSVLTQEEPSELKSWLEQQQFSIQDFYSGIDENEDRVYYPNPTTRKVLDHFYNLICQHTYRYNIDGKLESLTLEEIMDAEAQFFAKFLQEPEKIIYLPFSAFNFPLLLDPRVSCYIKMEHILSSHDLTKLPALPPSTTEVKPEKEIITIETFKLDSQLTDITFFKEYIKNTFAEEYVGILVDKEVDTLYKLAQVDPNALIRLGIPADTAQDLVGTAQEFCKFKNVFL
ncbi:MAG: DEAD/DEAH box helicase [Candidatus Helarchaeota archaeon]|nr:DEAD/DEAH box helicase [Candidatus Helarchaeota archaeon]